MKTTITTSVLFVALCAAAGASAQTWSAARAPETDTVMLSETTEGNYLVRRFVVRHQVDKEYPIRYQINLALLSSTLDDNSKELTELNQFVEKVMSDSLIRVESVSIIGYSSPDGPVALNESLAKKRAMDFKTYVDKKYGFSRKFDVKTSWVAEDWEMCRELVVQSPLADKQAVLNTIDGKWTPGQKEAALKKMPATWAYMKKQILPSLRRVELMIYYGQSTVVEQRTMIVKPQYILLQAPQPCCEVVDDLVTGIIVETDGPGTDFEQDVRHADKMTRAEMNAFRKEIHTAYKLSQKEAREADKVIRARAKAARQTAR